MNFKTRSETLKLNVTSAQLKENLDRKAFSPMTAIEGGYKGFLNFEGYWQSGKVFEGIPEQSVKKFWREKKDAGRKYPGSTGKRVLYAKFHDIDKKYDYITSRKEVYIPQYYVLIKNNERYSGCTLHKVTEIVDGGSIMFQEQVKIDKLPFNIKIDCY